jgi:hypothetical protein
MSYTNSPFNNIVVASLKAALFHLRAVRDTNSSLLGLVVTSLKFASLRHYFGTVCDTHSALLDLVGATLKAASLFHHLRAMSYTYSSFLGLFGTPSLKSASLHCCVCAMRPTNSFR